MSDPDQNKNSNPLLSAPVLVAIITGVFGVILAIITLVSRDTPAPLVEITAQAIQTVAASTAIAQQTSIALAFTTVPTDPSLPTHTSQPTITFTLSPAFTPTLMATDLVPSSNSPEPPLITETIPPSDCPSGLGFAMVYIPSTSFLMGGDIGPSNERPVREVTISGFCMDIYEVTNSQYQGCVSAGICTTPIRTNSTRQPNYYSDRGDFPVIWITWDQAQQYCAYHGDRAKAVGRLPTEAEWELAARYDPDTPSQPRNFPWGRTIPDGNVHANFAGSGIGDPIAIGQRTDGASVFGVQDLSGNVAEWVQDWYADGYNPTEIDNPTGVDAEVNGQGHAVRGGSYKDEAENIRAGYRAHSVVPQNYIGFRCVIKIDN